MCALTITYTCAQSKRLMLCPSALRVLKESPATTLGVSTKTLRLLRKNEAPHSLSRPAKQRTLQRASACADCGAHRDEFLPNPAMPTISCPVNSNQLMLYEVCIVA